MEKLYQIWKKFGKNFEEGGKLAKLSSFYDAFDTFLFTPQTTAKRNGTHIHDGSDSKRTMILVDMRTVAFSGRLRRKQEGIKSVIERA